MPVLINHDNVEKLSIATGVSRQPLITPERVNNDCILLDRWVLDAGATMNIRVAANLHAPSARTARRRRQTREASESEVTES